MFSVKQVFVAGKVLALLKMNLTKYNFASNVSFKDFIHIGIDELIGFLLLEFCQTTFSQNTVEAVARGVP